MTPPTEGTKGLRLLDAVLYGAMFTLGAWGMSKLIGGFDTDDENKDEDEEGSDD